jgi:hypothetical protein
MKETAVEWLVDELILEGFNVPKVFYDKAKEMEKEQIKEGYIMALLDGDAKIRRDAEDYYNETFKSE